MNLQIDYLRTLLAVVDTGGFTRAGERVHRSQSAVSMQIKRLEEQIGKPLLDRLGKSVKPTPDGRVLIRYARQIVKAHDDAVNALCQPGLKGVIRFGSPEHYTAGVLPTLLARFAATYPEVVVEMRCENSDRIKAAVDAGDLDIGLATQTGDSGQVIFHDPVVWIAVPGFVPTPGQPVKLAVFEEDCIFRTWAISALEKAARPFRIVYVSRSISGILDAVRAGLAIAPIVHSNVPKDLAVIGPAQGLPELPVSRIALHRNKTASPETIACFADYLVQAFRERH